MRAVSQGHALARHSLLNYNQSRTHFSPEYMVFSPFNLFIFAAFLYFISLPPSHIITTLNVKRQRQRQRQVHFEV